MPVPDHLALKILELYRVTAIIRTSSVSLVKIIRTSKCTLRFATQAKRDLLLTILQEYQRTVNFFLQWFWGDTPKIDKLNKCVYDLSDSWLSSSMRQSAAQEAVSIIKATIESRKCKDGEGECPILHGQRMHLRSETLAGLHPAKYAKHFDRWLRLASLSREEKLAINLPIKLHRHYRELEKQSRRCTSYIITPTYVQFAFEIETGKKRETGPCLGVDTGIKALATLSTGEQYGTDIEQCIERIKRCKHGSKGQKRARRALRQRVNETVKEVVETKQPRLIVAENLKGLNYQTKIRRRLNKNMRRSIGSWNYRYWLQRLEFACERNRVSFRSVNAAYTSQRCPACGCTDRRNRPTQEKFLCVGCGHQDHADVNAAKNILARFLTGPFGAGF